MQYQEQTSLCTWGVLQRALQVSHPGYSALIRHHEHEPQQPWRTEKGMLSDQPQLTCVTPTVLQVGTTANQWYDVTWDWLLDACHMAGVCWGFRCEGFCSKEGLHYCFEQSARNPLECDQVQIKLGNIPEAVIGQATINLILKFGNPLRIPYPSYTALLSGACVTWESWAWGFLWGRKVWLAFAQQTFAQETFGKRRKVERSPVVSLLPGLLEHLASRHPCVLCQKHVGACTTY
jgi:hypothetical protein